MTVLPSVLDTVHFTRTGQRLDLAEPGAWELDGYDTQRGSDVITSIDGPLDQAAVRQLAAAYPGVSSWQVRPANIDEIYRDHALAARRVGQLLDVDPHTARAVLTIAATEQFGMRFAYGRFVVAGDDDDQAWRIYSTVQGPEQILVPVCTRCGKPVFGATVEGRTVWVHASTDDYLACPVSDGDPIKARVDA